MPRFVLFATVHGGEFVVLGFHFSISNRVIFLKISKQFTDQNTLPSQLHLGLVVIGAVHAFVLGFLKKHFTDDHFFAKLLFHFRGHGTT